MDLLRSCCSNLVRVLLLGAAWINGAAAAEVGVGGNARLEALKVEATGKTGFRAMPGRETGLVFTNRLTGDYSLTNAVPHNGSGVALGDVDGDGRVDVYLCALQGANALFRNLGNWRFEPMDAGVAACADQSSTGAAFADVDGDGDLDLLVQGIGAGTRLFLNDGRGRWTESTDSGFSRTDSGMSLALADIDGDGDLDVYSATYIEMLYLADPTTRLTIGTVNGRPGVTRVNGQPADVPPWKDRFAVGLDGVTRELAEVDGLYLNDGDGKFRPIQNELGVFLNENGQPTTPGRELGLGVQFRDLNEDGFPDLVVTNDNGDPDRFCLNTGKGTFKAMARGAIRHGSHSSMGLDIADVNRDGVDDVFILDMLASTHGRRMTHPLKTDVAWDEIQASERRPMFGRNSLFLGRRDGTYSEVALMAGVAATDWSWCPIFLDVDLDGYEDLLVTTGFEQDVLDADSIDSIRTRKWTQEEMKRYRRIHPRWDSGNAAFRNRGDGTFEAVSGPWGFDRRGVSHGMALGDLDGDGDLDVVFNALNDAVGVSQNVGGAPRVAVVLQGRAPNTAGIGARIRVTGGRVVQSQEMMAGGRYLSGDQALRVFAAGANTSSGLRIEVVWPRGVTSVVESVAANQRVVVVEPEFIARQPVVQRRTPTPLFRDVTSWLGHAHVENVHDDWAAQPLLPWRVGRNGPGVAFQDINQDGYDDLIVTASRGGRIGLLISEEGRGFQRIDSQEVALGDQGGVVGWDDGAGNTSFLFAESNVEQRAGVDSQLLMFAPTAMKRLKAGKASAGALSLADVDGDGDLDVFCAGRMMPGQYPESVGSTVWINQGGELRLDAGWSRAFEAVGMVRGASFCDVNGDGWPDVALALEWGPVSVFLNRKTQFENATQALGLGMETGLWTGLAPMDVDGDGRLDLVVGNWGRNSVFELNAGARHRVYFGDWNGAGAQVLEAWGRGDVWRPSRDRTWLSRGMPGLEGAFANHHAFAEATVAGVLGNQAATASWKEAAVLESSVFLNRGDRFERVALPSVVQRSPALGLTVADVDGDGVEDVFVAQNFFGESMALTRGDGGQGVVLRGIGQGRFEAMDGDRSGIVIEGEQRGCAVSDLNHDGRVDLVVAQNNGSTRLFLNQTGTVGLRVKLDGGVSNPKGIGSQVRVVYADGTMGPVRWVGAGSGWGSQDSSVAVLGLKGTPAGLWVRWPGGREQRAVVTPGMREIVVRRMP